MARRVGKLHVIKGVLVVGKSGMTVGSGRLGVDADIQTIRDGLGRLVIPGETLAGCLVRVDGVERLDSRDRASQVWIEHAIETGPDADKAGSSVQTFDHVNRDRRTGTAAPGGLHSAELVRRGASFMVEITVEEAEGPDGESVALRNVTAIAGALRRGIQVGAKQSADQGHITCQDPRITTHDLSSPKGMLLRLIGLGGGSVPDVLGGKLPMAMGLSEFCTSHGIEEPAATANVLTITFPWRAGGPILSSTAAEGQVGRLPALTLVRVGNEEHLLGRITVRQPLRALAERIERTARGGDPEPPASAASDFDRQLMDGRCALSQVLFGATGGKESGRAAAWRQGAVHTRAHVVSSKQWAAIGNALTVPNSGERDELAKKRRKARIRLREAVKEDPAEVVKKAPALVVKKAPALVLREHNRIEPWSRSPLDGHLFAEIAIQKHVEWEPVTIHIDLDRLAATYVWRDDGDGARWEVGCSDEQARAALALTLLTLREASTFGLGAGGGASRALGWMEIDAKDVSFEAPEGSIAGFLNGMTLEEICEATDAPDHAINEVQDAWRSAVEGGSSDVAR